MSLTSLRSQTSENFRRNPPNQLDLIPPNISCIPTTLSGKSEDRHSGGLLNQLYKMLSPTSSSSSPNNEDQNQTENRKSPNELIAKQRTKKISIFRSRSSSARYKDKSSCKMGRKVTIERTLCNNGVVLSEREICELKHSWSHMEQRTERITVFFYRFLKQIQYPIADKVFKDHRLPLPSDTEILAHRKFAAHICQFIDFITQSLDKLSFTNQTELNDHIRQLGRRHCRKEAFSFTADKWLSFKCAFLKTMCGNNFTDLTNITVCAWSKFFIIVVAEMKRGYTKGIREMYGTSVGLSQKTDLHLPVISITSSDSDMDLTPGTDSDQEDITDSSSMTMRTTPRRMSHSQSDIGFTSTRIGDDEQR